MIPYGRHEIVDLDIEAVVDALRSNFITQGSKVGEFEGSVTNYVGAKFGVATNSATSALHLACVALGLSRDDWLWTSPISFVASANCGLYCGARIDFVDIDKKTITMCPIALEKKLVEAKRQNRLPKVVIPVHMAGQSCDMVEIHKLSKIYGFNIIEDASHAIGGHYDKNPVGCCRYSDVTVFSFHPVKIITTAEGGMAVTNKKEVAEKMALLRSHGVTRDENKMSVNSDGPWFYQQIETGFNYRMNELQAALGISQFKRLNDIVVRRNDLANRYDKLLEKHPLSLPLRIEGTYSSFHLYIVRLRFDYIKIDKKQIFYNLKKKGIGVNVHYIPIHTQPVFKGLGFTSGDFPEAEHYYSEAMTIPLFHTMTNEQQDMVAEALMSSLL